jgi:hypothetical protein
MKVVRFDRLSGLSGHVLHELVEGREAASVLALTKRHIPFILLPYHDKASWKRSST